MDGSVVKHNMLKRGRSPNRDFIREALSHGQKGSMQGALQWGWLAKLFGKCTNFNFFDNLQFGFAVDLYSQKCYFHILSVYFRAVNTIHLACLYPFQRGLDRNSSTSHSLTLKNDVRSTRIFLCDSSSRKGTPLYIHLTQHSDQSTS